MYKQRCRHPKVAKLFKIIIKIYGKQKVEKEIAKGNKKSRNLSTIVKYFYIYVVYNLTDRHTDNMFIE